MNASTAARVLPTNFASINDWKAIFTGSIDFASLNAVIGLSYLWLSRPNKARRGRYCQ